jgi:hypothetical protein
VAQQLLLSVDKGEFVARVLPLAITRKKGKMITDIVAHLAFENDLISRAFTHGIIKGLEDNDYDGIRAYFRIAMRLVTIEDSLKTKRLESFMTSFINTINSQFRYWKITDFCLEHLIRMVKKSPDVHKWMVEHASLIDPLSQWLTQHIEPPMHSRDRGNNDVVLLKPAQQMYYQQGHQGNSAYGYPTRKKFEFLEALKSGKELEAEGASDSDVDFSDRVLKEGDWVDCLDTSHNYLCSRIVRVEGTKVQIHYDSWSDKWDEWLEMSHPRIRTLGTMTSKEQVENRGKPRKASTSN